LLLMTTGQSPLDQPTAVSLGFAGWVSKPLQAIELYERLCTLIEPGRSPHPKAA
jgi:hypothetical protein